MNTVSAHRAFWIASLACLIASPAWAQRGRRGPGGPGGPRGPSSPDLELVDKYDADKDGRLNREERAEARKELEGNGNRRRRPRSRQQRDAGKTGEKVQPTEVETYSDSGTYDQSILRTVFLEFENEDWESELEAFKPTDVLIPATLTADGTVYSEVGVSFRGASSFFMVPAGLKRSLNISFDFVNDGQRFGEVKTLNLLNCNGDESMLSTLLYSNIARTRMAAPRANFVQVVINGESWGVYCSVEQFNKDFLKRNFGTSKGARWKVSGSPNGDGGLRYLGEDLEPYRERFDLKSKEDPEAWKALIHLCKVLDETAPADLPKALDSLIDIDAALWFLAVDVALLNSDGYWTRASDFSIYLDPSGRFHILPHDMNEAFKEHSGPPGGGPGGRRRGPRGGGFPGFGGGPEGAQPPGEGGPPQRRRGGPGGARQGATLELDPLVGLQDETKPLRSKLLANSEFKTRYLQHVKYIAQDLLKWQYLGPHVANARTLLLDAVTKDTRKLGTTEGFLEATSAERVEEQASIRSFAQKRSKFLLENAAIEALPDKVAPLGQRIGKPASSVQDWPRVKSPLRINELMAVPMADTAGDKARSTDWIEIYNSGEKAIDLTGCCLSDDPETPGKWQFPAEMTIEPDHYLIIWADKGSNKDLAGLHANFKLSKKGEHLLLTNESTVLCELEYPEQGMGKSFGWLEGETGYLAPTPRAANRE